MRVCSYIIMLRCDLLDQFGMAMLVSLDSDNRPKVRRKSYTREFKLDVVKFYRENNLYKASNLTDFWAPCPFVNMMATNNTLVTHN